ncbi:Secreted protein [Pseudomonas sp. IT-P253]
MTDPPLSRAGSLPQGPAATHKQVLWLTQGICDEMRPHSLSRRAAITRRETPSDSPFVPATADHRPDDRTGLHRLLGQ